MALSDPKIIKRKDVSNDEKLFEASKDEGFNLPLSTIHQEKLVVLAKKCNPVSLGTEEIPHITFYAESFLTKEQENISTFLKERKLSFVWTYANMPNLDPELVVHHLVVYLKEKPMGQKLRNMHL